SHRLLAMGGGAGLGARPVAVPAVAIAAVAVARGAIPGQRRGAHGPEPIGRNEAAGLDRALQPVALLADVGDLGLAVDLGHGHEVDHRLGPAGVGELELPAVAEGVVGAGVDADAAQDAAALVD